MILSDLTETTLSEEAAKTAFPKWNTLCLLRLLGLPTMNAAFIPPGSSANLIRETLYHFAKVIGKSRVLLRSDGGRERRNYYRGGNSLLRPYAAILASRLSSLRRAVVLTEPTIRFDNKLSIHFRADASGDFTIELLGPGFDASHINRSIVLPEYTVHGNVESWRRHQTLQLSDIRGNPTEIRCEKRRRLGLKDIGKNILPGTGIRVRGGPSIFAEEWLLANGYEGLWRPWAFSLDRQRIQRWYDDAFMVASYFNSSRNWVCFVLYGSVLSDYRFVYWDVVDAAKKWG